MTFALATLEAAWDETPSLRALSFHLGAFAPLHQVPGQYLAVRAEGREGYFALSSAPAATGMAELLVKRGSPLADWLCSLEPGQTLEHSSPQGKGFRVHHPKDQDLILVGAGSGMGPLRAVIQHVMAHRGEFGRVMLYYGQRQESDFAYVKEHVEWQRSSIEVVRVCSQPNEGYQGPRGYVQDALRTSAPNLTRAAAFLAGSKGLVAGATEVLEALGLGRERIYLNY